MIRKERWKDIRGYKGLYQISNYGKIKSLYRKCLSKNGSYRIVSERILKLSLDKDDYYIIALNKKGFRKTFKVARLVGFAFVKGYKKGLEINHKKGNKLDNRAWMLEWTTASKNIKHSFDVLGKINGKSEKCINLKTRKTYISIKKASKTTNYSYSYFQKMLAGERINISNFVKL